MRIPDITLTVDDLIDHAKRSLATWQGDAARYIGKEPLNEWDQRQFDAARARAARCAGLIDALVSAKRGHAWGHHVQLLREAAVKARDSYDNARQSYDWADYQTEREAADVGWCKAYAEALESVVASLAEDHNGI